MPTPTAFHSNTQGRGAAAHPGSSTVNHYDHYPNGVGHDRTVIDTHNARRFRVHISGTVFGIRLGKKLCMMRNLIGDAIRQRSGVRRANRKRATAVKPRWGLRSVANRYLRCARFAGDPELWNLSPWGEPIRQRRFIPIPTVRALRWRPWALESIPLGRRLY